MSRCGCSSGPVGACACAFTDSDCFNVTGAGTAENPFVIDPIFDPDPENTLTCGVNGMSSATDEAIVNPPIGWASQVGGSIPHNVLTAVQFNVADFYDTDNMHDPGGDSTRFTANTAATYHFDAALTLANNATGARAMATIANGVLTFGNDSENTPSATVDTDLDTSGDVPLGVGQFAQVFVIQTSGGPLTLVKARITWHRVGPYPF